MPTLKVVVIIGVLATVGIQSPVNSTPQGTPEQGVAKQRSGAQAEESKRTNGHENPAPNVTVIVKQEQSPANKPDEKQPDENIAIQRRLANLTTWLVIVGALQRGDLLPNDKNSSSDLPTFTPSTDRLEMIWVAPTLKNYGKTPGTITKIRAKGERVASGFKVSVNPDYATFDTKKIDYETVLPPGISIQPVRIGIATGDFVAINDGSMAQYIRGVVEYRDVNNRKRRTEFCFWYRIQEGYNPDPTGFYMSPPEYNKAT